MPRFAVWCGRSRGTADPRQSGPASPVPEIRDLTRREFLIGAAGLLLLPAGCGGGGEQSVRVVSETGRTRTVYNAFGKTEVPKNPERVISLGQEDMLADLLSIGVRPVASLSNLPDSFPGIEPGKAKGIEPILTSGEANLERLVALSPDLIIGHSFFVERAGYAELSEIAPTVAVADVDATSSYIQTLEVFGEGDLARRRAERFARRVEAGSRDLGAAGRTVSLATVYPGPSVAAWVDGPTPAPRLILDLGFRLAPDRDEVEGLLARVLPGVFGLSEGRAYLGDEEIVLLDGGTLILLLSPLVKGEKRALGEVRSGPLWRSLPAVKSGRVYELDRLGYPGFPGQERLLEDLLRLLRDGEPGGGVARDRPQKKGARDE